MIDPIKRQHDLFSQVFDMARKPKVTFLDGNKAIVERSPECSGRGKATCEKNGEHSWFNHAMDFAFGDLPQNINNYKEMDIDES